MTRERAIEVQRRDMYAFCLGTLEQTVKNYLNGSASKDELARTLKDIDKMLGHKQEIHTNGK